MPPARRIQQRLRGITTRTSASTPQASPSMFAFPSTVPTSWICAYGAKKRSGPPSPLTFGTPLGCCMPVTSPATKSNNAYRRWALTDRVDAATVEAGLREWAQRRSAQ